MISKKTVILGIGINMASLQMPTSGTIYVETPIAIYTVEPHPTYAPLLRPLWQVVQAQSVQIISSELTLLEALIHPIRRQDSGLQAAYERLLLAMPAVTLLPLTQDVLREAARLRASIPGLRTPDALHAATALLAGCALLLTNDTGFRRVPDLPLVILDDVLVA